jgi:uncharacterized protein (DUF736 family)
MIIPFQLGKRIEDNAPDFRIARAFHQTLEIGRIQFATESSQNVGEYWNLKMSANTGTCTR